MAIKRIEILPSWQNVSLLSSLRWTTFLCSRKMALQGARPNVQMFALEVTHASFRHNRMSIEPLTFNCNVLVRQPELKGDENFLQHMFQSTFKVKKRNSVWLWLMASPPPKSLKGCTAPIARDRSLWNKVIFSLNSHPKSLAR